MRAGIQGEARQAILGLDLPPSLLARSARPVAPCNMGDAAYSSPQAGQNGVGALDSGQSLPKGASGWT
jgi:hypothetical protein